MSATRRRVVRGQLSLLEDVAWCRRCRRRLTNARAVKRGIGRTCAQREAAEHFSESESENENEDNATSNTAANGNANTARKNKKTRHSKRPCRTDGATELP